MNTRPPPTLASAAVPSTPCIFISISNYPSLDLVTAGFCSSSIIFAQHCLTWWSNPSRRPYWSVPLPPLHRNPPPHTWEELGVLTVHSGPSLRREDSDLRQYFKNLFGVFNFLTRKMCTTKWKLWTLSNRNCGVISYGRLRLRVLKPLPKKDVFLCSNLV